jgi:hypothetical protein
LRTAIHIGIGLTEYDEMTPYELTIHTEIFTEKEKQNYEDRVTIAYIGEWFHRQDKLEISILNKMLGKEEQTKEMSDDEMLETVNKLNALFGGSVVTQGGEANGDS